MEQIVAIAIKDGYMVDEMDETKQGRIFCHKDKFYEGWILTDCKDPDFYYVHDEIDNHHGMDKEFFDEYFAIQFSII